MVQVHMQGITLLVCTTSCTLLAICFLSKCCCCLCCLDTREWWEYRASTVGSRWHYLGLRTEHWLKEKMLLMSIILCSPMLYSALSSLCLCSHIPPISCWIILLHNNNYCVIAGPFTQWIGLQVSMVTYVVNTPARAGVDICHQL